MALKLQKDKTDLLGYIATIGLALAGITLIVIGHSLPDPLWKDIIKDVGGTVLGVGVLAFVWELFTKRSFREETLALVNVAAALDKAGVEEIELEYLRLDWRVLFENAERLDIFFAYGKTWSGSHDLDLKKLMAKKNFKIRIIFPDPNNSECMQELTRRFVGYTMDKTISLVNEGIQSFTELAAGSIKKGVMEIKTTKTSPVFTIYNFGTKAVFILYRHKSGKGEVPSFVIRKGGALFAFLESEFDFLWAAASGPLATAPTNTKEAVT